MTNEKNLLVESQTRSSRARFISVEPVYGLVLAIQGAITTARVQYTNKRLERMYNYTLLGGNCSFENATADVTGLRIQSETARWDMMMSSITVIIPIVTGPLLVAASDVVGRKPLLIISALSHVISVVIIMAVALFDLPLSVILVAKVIFGVFGDAAMPEAVCNAYIGDSVKEENRAVKLAAMDSASFFGWGLGKVITNLIIEETSSFTIAFSFPLVLAVICLFYTACPGILLETITRSESQQKETLSVRMAYAGIAKNLKTLFGPELSKVRWRIGALLVIKVLLNIVKESIYTVGAIIGLGKPFCWSPYMVGIYEALIYFLPGIAAFFLTKPLILCFNEYWLLHLGTLSFIGQVTTMGLAKTTFQLAYLGSFIGFLRILPPIMVKTLLSNHVSSDQQGSIFAAFSIVVSTANTISPFVISGIYSVTVTAGCPRLVFYISAALLACAILFNGLLQLFVHKERKEDNIQLEAIKE